MSAVAAASSSVKRSLWRSTVQQTRVRRLYKQGNRTRVKVLTWAAPKKNATHDELAREAFATLMRTFYDRGLKKGFVLRAGEVSYISILETGLADSGVCPLCDGKLDPRNRVIDHFFPQEGFPALTCFPDNLIPICDTCNGPRAKLAKPPYTPTIGGEVDVTDWFHPRWRTAQRQLVVRVARNGNRLELTVEPTNALFAPHVDNFVQLTNVHTTWSDRLRAALRQEQDEVESELRRLRIRGIAVDRTVVQETLIEKRDYYERKIGSEEYAYRNYGIYNYMANDHASIQEILAQVNE
ncbi:HNH endonuclease [Blastopirellula sp. JC732]|uniref:HNH endonuclease n=1 Tax=Blastopirellula sediminis TaxID=2894196 RepID=A0A9X1MPJ4_9BACT|nr:HNH endonuclease [Blastopirellula sediminis]MCC9606228.1 HNH endonuclease [Blastopirellula sediminis]MCC9630474.1 HNH endonuclease [Blastopirellula sediminis]